MKDYIESLKTYVTTYKKELIIGVAVVAVAIAMIVTAVAMITRSAKPDIVYKPANACDLFTKDEAAELMGDQVISSNNKTPVLSDNTTLSRCGYTDGNPDKDNMIVAAVVVRSGINDKGVEQNKTEFINGKPKGVEIVESVGDDAYFNEKNGQLNVLSGRDWFIFSYGPGSDPRANTVDDAIKLASKTIETQSASTKF